MRLFLAGNMTGQDPSVLFQRWEQVLTELGFEVTSPPDLTAPLMWEELLQKHSFPIASKMLVETDLSLIDRADAVLAILISPSVGTAIEIHYAFTKQVPVFVIVPWDSPLRYHPFLWAYAQVVVLPKSQIEHPDLSFVGLVHLVERIERSCSDRSA